VRGLERLLDREEEVGERMDVDGNGTRKEKTGDWEKEAAYAMATVYASNGDAAMARDITEKYLVVE